MTASSGTSSPSRAELPGIDVVISKCAPVAKNAALGRPGRTITRRERSGSTYQDGRAVQCTHRPRKKPRRPPAISDGMRRE